MNPKRTIQKQYGPTWTVDNDVRTELRYHLMHISKFKKINYNMKTTTTQTKNKSSKTNQPTNKQTTTNNNNKITIRSAKYIHKLEHSEPYIT